MKLLNNVCIALYYLLRPLLGPAQCQFELSCGLYAIKQLQEQSLLRALVAICKRLWLCSPWGIICYYSFILSYSSSPANLLSSLRSLVSRYTEPNNGTPLKR